MLDSTRLKVTVLYDKERDTIVYDRYGYRGGVKKSSLEKLEIDNSYFRLRLIRKRIKFPSKRRQVQYGDPQLRIVLRDGTERNIYPELDTSNLPLIETIMSVGVQEGGIVNAYLRFCPKSISPGCTDMRLISLGPEDLVPEKAVSSTGLTPGRSKVSLSDLALGKIYYYKRRDILLVYLGRAVIPGFRYLTVDNHDPIKAVLSSRFNGNYHYSKSARDKWVLGSDDILLFATITENGRYRITNLLTEEEICNSRLCFVSLTDPEKLVPNLQEIDLRIHLDIGKPVNLKDIIRKYIIRWWDRQFQGNDTRIYWKDVISIKEIRDYLDIPESLSSEYFKLFFNWYSRSRIDVTGFPDSIDLFGISEEQFMKLTGSSEKA